MSRPRSHWALLLLVLLTVATGLLVTGYVHHEIGDAGTARAGDVRAAQTVPATVTDGGPVITGTSPIRTLRMPARTVALSFDDGPDPTWTPQVLAVLRRRHVPATFFVVGSRALEHPGLVRAELAAGEVGLHTFTHVDLPRLPAWQRALEVSLTQHALAHAVEMTSSLIRPPYSSGPDAIDDRGWQTVQWAAGQGLTTVLANRDGEDWQRPDVEQIVRNASPTGTAGAIVLLHDGGGNRSQTVAALDRLITDLQQRGYRLTTVTGALGLGAAEVHADARERLRGWALALLVRSADVGAGLMEVLLVVVGLLSIARALVVVTLAAGTYTAPAAQHHGYHPV